MLSTSSSYACRENLTSLCDISLEHFTVLVICWSSTLAELTDLFLVSSLSDTHLSIFECASISLKSLTSFIFYSLIRTEYRRPEIPLDHSAVQEPVDTEAAGDTGSEALNNCSGSLYMELQASDK